MDASTFLVVAVACSPMVDPSTARALVAAESGFNPRCDRRRWRGARQPRNRVEAIATARALEASGWTYSVGLDQVNSRNFARLGLTASSAFEPCENLRAMQAVLSECLERSHGSPQLAARVQARFLLLLQRRLRGGFRDGHVARVLRSARLIAARTYRP